MEGLAHGIGCEAPKTGDEADAVVGTAGPALDGLWITRYWRWSWSSVQLLSFVMPLPL
jgi:hypothetical protein